MSAAPTKEELEEKAKQLETRLDEEIAKVKADRPHEAEGLEHQKKALETLAEELEKATEDNVVAAIEGRLNGIEHMVERELERLEGRTGTPNFHHPTGTGRPHRTTEAEQPTVSPA